MEENNKRILKNTIYLYIRMFVMMALSFVSTRIVLDKLGVDDYGIYNVVGGFVAMFTILNNVLQSATRRFLSVAIGKGEQKLIDSTFSTSLTMHLVIGGVVVVLLETLGAWLLNNTLNIAADRMYAANWVLQFSIINVLLAILQTPFQAAVTSHEKFNVYAIMSIFDVMAKIAILFLLVLLPFDKLIVYAILLSCVNVLSNTIYLIFCRKNFHECKMSLVVDKSLMYEMLKFSGWDSLGNISSILNAQGVTILLNLFFTTAVNAARGLATTVTTTIANFVTGFITAAEPQLAKYYVNKEAERFNNLIFNISRMTLFMLAVIAVPVFMEMDYVLRLWLNEVPDYTSAFIKITIIGTFVQYSNSMVLKGIVAIGKVKQITTLTTPLYFIHIPLVYIVLKLGWSPVSAYWVSIIPSCLGFLMNLHILHNHAGFPSRKYFFEVFVKNVALILCACIPPYFVQIFFESSFSRFILVCSVSILSTITILWFLALNKEVRQIVLSKVFTKKSYS